MTTTEVKVAKLPILGIALGFILMFVGFIWHPWMGTKNIDGLYGGQLTALEFGFAMLFFFALVSWLGGLLAKRGIFSSDDLIMMYMLMMIGFAIGGPVNLLIAQPLYVPAAYPYVVQSDWVPSFWATTNEASKAILARTGIDWGPTMGPLMYWGVLTFIWELFMISIPMLFLEQWRDVEALPFPYATTMQTFLATDEHKIPAIFKNKIFWGGFLVAFALYHPSLVQVFSPSYPYIAWPFYDMLGMKMASTISTDPLLILFYMLFSTRVLLSFWVGGFIMWGIIPAISMSVGIVPDTTAQGSWPTTWMWWGSTEQSVFKWLPFTGGMSIGIALMAIYLARKPLAQTFSTGLKKPAEKPWALIFIASLVLVYIMQVAMGVDVLYITITFVWMILAWIGYARIATEFSASECCWHNINFSWGIYYFVGQGNIYSPVSWKSLTFGTHIGGFPVGPNQGSGSMPFPMVNGLYMASLAKLDLKKIFWMAIIATAIVTFVGYPLITWLITTYGPTDFFWWWYTRWVGIGVETSSYEVVAPTGQALAVIYGAIFAIILGILGARFTWFPIGPVGWAFASASFDLTASLVALIIKYLLLRTYGVRAQTDYIVPFAIGWLTAFSLIQLTLRLPALLVTGKFPIG